MSVISVNLPQTQYPIYIQNDLLSTIGVELKKIYTNKKIAIITDSNIEKLYGSKIENALLSENFIVKKIVIKPGEKSKSFETLQNVCESLLNFGLNRGDLILTFGGGVVGDLGGFAASIVLRGTPFIQIPTSLLAQIDSSIGGKVAINSENGKNLIGSFYQPTAVFIDPTLLKTLSERQFNDGLAEVIKYGAIRDASLFSHLLQYETREILFSHIEEIIYTCCTIKKEIVEKDEKDFGERMLLNFGHTLGHGIEKYFNFEKFTHGEAVAMGMYAITKASETLGISEEGTSDLLLKILKKYNLPYTFPLMKQEDLLQILQLDKKNINETMHIILLKKIGCSYIKKITHSDLAEYIGIY